MLENLINLFLGHLWVFRAQFFLPISVLDEEGEVGIGVGTWSKKIMK
jgi:hypothetical protein